MFDIGSSLREARLRQNLDFPELGERTKIRPKYLRALEDERFDILPAPTYVRGFLRSYAESLGHARAGAAEAVRRTLPAARARGAGQRGRPGQRQSRRPAGRDDVRRHRTEDHPGHLLTRPRAAIVVTGSELVRGHRQDRNGPFLAAEAVRPWPRPGPIAIPA